MSRQKLSRSRATWSHIDDGFSGPTIPAILRVMSQLPLCDKNIVVSAQRASRVDGPSSCLTLAAGTGFESRRRAYDVGDFIVVDAFLPPGLRAPLHQHERAYFTLILRGGFEERFA